MMGRGFDARRSADLLVAATTALADWPGRPNVLYLSGGRDPRLLLAAAVAGGIDFEVVSTGAPEDPDVRTARQLCEALGVGHHVRARDPGGALPTRLLETARMLGITGGGGISLEDASGYFNGSDGALPHRHPPHWRSPSSARRLAILSRQPSGPILRGCGR